MFTYPLCLRLPLFIRLTLDLRAYTVLLLADVQNAFDTFRRVQMWMLRYFPWVADRAADGIFPSAERDLLKNTSALLARKFVSQGSGAQGLLDYASALVRSGPAVAATPTLG
ncbi:uncharacterized protein FOMMEDRAFT_162435 [Fomitiporia mediterranea MF3/22]|uniref:uncharacterized protein n=1 Tax=Fomitiporia mediterranea (strain MF3/22) TaxID=694068 RepID=UPI000440859A|nr:uncharacterized protein FOMMEDRAFT_162435 [Fomitiporia mediterranea MF3/22]EJC98083.1 hypothetical protein FOMMEDRAFT_162435 [Fomitiporia mediterranea MF3/22]